ncbi:MAG: peptidoglycan-binding protein [Peptococcaceae bacterium]|nr:peptidoglycan-binding protein [Peptococcaceae bacterium]
MRRNGRLFLCILTLVLILAPVFPSLAAGGAGDTLQVGSRGDRVAELQLLLQKAGFFPASQKATGYFGWITYRAVTDLEKKYGLPVNGRVGADEWNILYRLKMPKAVMGYYTVDYPGDRLSYNSLLNYGWLVNQVAMFDFFVDGNGNLKGGPSAGGIDLARKRGAKTLMVVHNVKAGSFDSQSAYSAISVKSNRDRLVDNIVSEIEKNGYDGVNIDIEGIPPYGRDHFNAFLEQLSGTLKPKSKLITLAVPAKTGDQGNSWTQAYDYKTIGRLADYVAIMTYDEHWMNGTPGPVASLPWVTRVIEYSAGVIPPNKILMGIGCYGYDWPDGKKGTPVKWKDVPNLAAKYGPAGWNNIYSVPCLTYTVNGVRHQVWFENRYSLAIKLNLVENYGLGGIAMWRLGFEDASFWDTVEKRLIGKN